MMYHTGMRRERIAQAKPHIIGIYVGASDLILRCFSLALNFKFGGLDINPVASGFNSGALGLNFGTLAGSLDLFALWC